MEESTEILELKFEGNGINPSQVKASEIAELIRNFEEAITSIVKESHPELSEDFVLISFEEIKNESLSIKNIGHKARELVLPAYFILTTSFSNNNFNNLSYKTIEHIRTFTRFSKKYGCDGVFIKGTERIATFHPTTEVTLDDSRYLRGETTLYGILQRIGGEDPRITVKIKEDYHVSFELKKEFAIQLASKLYKEIGLVGVAKWDRKNYRIVDFKTESIIDFDSAPISDSLKEIGDMLNKYFKDIEDFTTYINDV